VRLCSALALKGQRTLSGTPDEHRSINSGQREAGRWRSRRVKDEAQAGRRAVRTHEADVTDRGLAAVVAVDHDGAARLRASRSGCGDPRGGRGTTGRDTHRGGVHGHARPVSDGTDPHVGGCYDDGLLADKAPLMEDGVQIGALELRYSPRCRAGWARVYLYPGQPTMLGIATVAAADGRQASMGDPMVRQVPVYTDVILPGNGGCLSAKATAYTTGHTPLTAAIPCEQPWTQPGAISRPS
jgi:hypothetical protein